MILNEKKIKNLIKKIQTKVEQNNKSKVDTEFSREVLEEDTSLEVFNEMKRRPHT